MFLESLYCILGNTCELRKIELSVISFLQRKDIQDRVILKEVMAPPSSDEEISLSDEEIMYESVRRVKFALEKRRGVRGSSYDVECDHRSCKYIQFGTKVLRGRCMGKIDHLLYRLVASQVQLSV